MIKSLLLSLLFVGQVAWAALPIQYDQCQPGKNPAPFPLNFQDMAKLVKVVICQNRETAFTPDQTLELLKLKTVTMGISLEQTSFSYDNLMSFAKVQPYVLFVDSVRLFPEQLASLSEAGVQVVVFSDKTSFLTDGLKAIARKEPFTFVVNSSILQESLKELASRKVHLVIEASKSFVSKETLAELAKADPDSVTLKP